MLETYYLNFISRQLHTQNNPKSKKTQYWQIVYMHNVHTTQVRVDHDLIARLICVTIIGDVQTIKHDIDGNKNGNFSL